MSLVRYRPLPLAPIKTLALSTWLKQTAGLPGPSSLSRARQEQSLSPNQCPADPVGAMVVLIGEDRQRDVLELGPLATCSGAQHRKMEQSKPSVKQSLCDGQPSAVNSSGPPRVSLQDATAGRRWVWTKVLIGSTTNWLTCATRGKENYKLDLIRCFYLRFSQDPWKLIVSDPLLPTLRNSPYLDWIHYPPSEVDSETSSVTMECLVFV